MVTPVPAVIAVTTPADTETVPAPEVEELHVPPAVASAKVVDKVAQTVLKPVIAAGTGLILTVEVPDVADNPE